MLSLSREGCRRAASRCHHSRNMAIHDSSSGIHIHIHNHTWHKLSQRNLCSSAIVTTTTNTHSSTTGSIMHHGSNHAFSMTPVKNVSWSTLNANPMVSSSLGVFSHPSRNKDVYFSTTSKSQPTIEITQTTASSSNQDSPNDNDNQTNKEQEQEQDENIENNQKERPKPSQQIAEEELYSLMSSSKQHYQHANYTQALSISHQFLSSAIELFGPNHPVVASAHNNVGLMSKMLGEYDTSRESYHAALEIYGRLVGEDHANYAATLHNLGVLDRTQAAMEEEEEVEDGKAGMSFLQRMNYNDRAVEYFEKALEIREVELGVEHVHTITSRSSLGNAIAAQVIQTEVLRQRRLNRMKENNSNDDGESDIEKEEREMSERQIVSKYTKKKWEMAEKNLRDALRMAVDNPRGEMITIPNPTSGIAGSSSKKPKKGTARQRKMMVSQNDVNMTTEMENDSTNATSTKTTDNNNTTNDDSFESFLKLGLGEGDTSIRTTSAALAAQNLSVFLKTRADLISASSTIQSSENTATINPSLDSGDMYAEAKNLYIGALRVRTKLKGPSHPDTVSTKFSLSELIDTLGDEDTANKMRQELLDIYQVEERDGLISSDDSSDSNGAK